MPRGATDRSLRERARRVIPGGMYGHESARLLPGTFPQFFSRAEGAYLWDLDGNRYLDLMCAYGPNLLGYGHPRVNAAAVAQLQLGDTMTGPSAVMVDLAETFVSMVSHADWAIFCKNGTDATTMAMTAARAQTGRRRILVAAHAYHGAAPWCTPVPIGVVPEEKRFISSYTYNDIDTLEAAVADAGDDLAGIFVSPFKHDAFEDQQLVEPGFATTARDLCDRAGAMLILDDVRAGFRLARDSSWEPLGVRPDLSAWGKSFANGQPISALLGSDTCRSGATRMYSTGSFWFSAVPMAAAIETLTVLRESDYLEHIIALGERLRAGLDKAASEHGFTLRQTGPVQMPQVLFEGDEDFRVGFAFASGMLERGVYVHPWHNMFLCAAMSDADMDMAITAANGALAEVAATVDNLTPHPLVQAVAANR
ncbi:MAG: aminotransferase class III-fold pyridoxal phosphate-dependent enzyme [Acidimicrobiaceae bacterium]|nr:aminotransferase class III-fold pyridoxal phosphate-dependent enzyme [Acidimicrobiaceae bacterium]